jgi:site-specific recombinase XerD
MTEIQTKRRNALRASASKIILEYARTRVNGRPASDASVRARHQTLMAACNQLWTLGYQLQDIRNLEQRHIRALVQHWFKSNYQPKTIENSLSNLRLLSGWIGKPSLVPERNAARHFLPDVPPEHFQVGTVAARSKSWSESGVDVSALIERAHAIDVRFGAMLFLGVAFGLRRQEQVLIRPHQADGGTHLRIRDDIAKGGRDRDVPIQHPFQRAALDNAKSVVRQGESLGWPRGSKQANLRHHTYLMREHLHISKRESGCVAHGLRAEYSENVSLLAGLVPPVLGGTKHQMPPARREAIQQQLSENLGHNRTRVTGAYVGSFRVSPRVPVARENTIVYRGWTLNVTVDLQNNHLIGVLAQVREHVEFVATTPAELRTRFQQAVDEKLAGKTLGDGLPAAGASVARSSRCTGLQPAGSICKL